MSRGMVGGGGIGGLKGGFWPGLYLAAGSF